jgi:YbgC/YbaW family acyl-CoA thioester hydrolase
MQKIVVNAHYLMYVDTAMADYWRALAVAYEVTLQELGGDLYVKKSTLEYYASARYDDTLDIGLKCSRLGSSSMVFAAAVFRGSEMLIEGELVYVFADPQTQTSKPLPQALRDLLQGFESGQTMFTVRCGSWSELGADAARLRTEVFVQEQNIPLGKRGSNQP